MNYVMNPSLAKCPPHLSLNTVLGTKASGWLPIQIRPHSVHHQSTPLQDTGCSLQPSSSRSFQLPSRPTSQLVLAILVDLGHSQNTAEILASILPHLSLTKTHREHLLVSLRRVGRKRAFKSFFTIRKVQRRANSTNVSHL